MPYAANQKMAQNEARALEYRRTLPPSQRFGTPTGIARARDISNQVELSIDTILRMNSYLARTEALFREQDRLPEEQRGKQWWATQLWGGAEAYDWVADKLQRLANAGEI